MVTQSKGDFVTAGSPTPTFRLRLGSGAGRAMGAQLSNLDCCIPYEPDCERGCDGCLPCEDPWGSKRSHKSKDFFEARADENQWKEAMERTKQHKMHGFAAPPHGPDASASKFFWHSGQAHSDSAGPQHVDA